MLLLVKKECIIKTRGSNQSIRLTKVHGHWTISKRPMDLVVCLCAQSPYGLIGQFTPVLALYDPFGIDVALNMLNFDITHTLNHHTTSSSLS